MRTGARVAAFVVALLTVFAVSVWVGRAAGPDGAAMEQGHAASESSESPGGLQSTQSGYTLDLTDSIFPAAPETPLRFRILGDSGPVTRYEESHEKQLHLIVVRNDLTAYQHLHPVRDDDGTWRVPVDFRQAGDYRVFADFVPAGGPALTLGANVHVAGEYDPQPLPGVRAVSNVDGYAVTLDGAPEAGEASTLTLSVSRDGTAVDDLQPYLGAYGHLVALRAADLAYLHVHPLGEPGTTPAGPQIEFRTTFPSVGDYRLFLDFQHRGVVRTAEFTVSVTDSAPRPPAPAEHREDGHGH